MLTRRQGMNVKTRDYDEEPIVITNYSVLYESHLIMLIALIGVPLLGNKIYNVMIAGNRITPDIVIGLVIWIYLLYLMFWVYPKGFKKKKNFFIFTDKFIKYHYEYIAKDDADIDLIMDTDKVKNITHCIVCELPDSYGRWHYLSAWKLYRKSSIGVHIGKVTLFMRYFMTYLLFIFPSKLKRLRNLEEPYSLINKNLFIQFSNRNYFLINIYSENDYDALQKYFATHDIFIMNKTHFIPHLQDQGWFVDKEEIWEDNLKQKGWK